ncbi:MAG: F0F1 ATP synthase subunit B [Anaerolineales bacterium]|jgi:F-type H+-transporting ATPase subunit b
MQALGINLGYLLVQILNFLIMLVVLRKWVYPPLLKMLESRRQKITQSLQDARVVAEARANAEKEAAEVLAVAQRQAAQRLKDATDRADAVMQEMREATQRDLEDQRKAASEEAEAERNRILADLRVEIAGLAIAAAQKLIGEALSEERQRELISNFFSGVRSGKVEVLQGISSLPGATAEVVSALPLTEEEEDVVRRDMVTRMGGGATLSFRVDPTILGGLKIRVGDRVLDGSVAGQLGSLRESLH